MTEGSIMKLLSSDQPLVGGVLNPITFGSKIKVFLTDYKGKYLPFLQTVKARKENGLDDHNLYNDYEFNPFKYKGEVVQPVEGKRSFLYGKEKIRINSSFIIIEGWDTPEPEWLDNFVDSECRNCGYFTYIKLNDEVLSEAGVRTFGWEDEKREYSNLFLMKKDDPYSIWTEEDPVSFEAGIYPGSINARDWEVKRVRVLFAFLKGLILGVEGHLKFTHPGTRRAYSTMEEGRDEYEFVSFRVKKEDKYPVLFSFRRGIWGSYSNEEKMHSYAYLSIYVDNVENEEKTAEPYWETKAVSDVSLEDIKCSHVIGYGEPYKEEMYDYDYNDNLYSYMGTVTPKIEDYQYNLQDFAEAVRCAEATYKVSGYTYDVMEGLCTLLPYIFGENTETISLVSFDEVVKKPGIKLWKNITYGETDGLSARIVVDQSKPWVYSESPLSLEAEKYVYCTSMCRYELPEKKEEGLRLTLSERIDIDKIFTDKKVNIYEERFEDLRYFNVTVDVEGSKRVKVNLEDIEEVVENHLSLELIKKGRFTIIERKMGEDGTLLWRKRPFLDQDSLEEFTPVSEKSE